MIEEANKKPFWDDVMERMKSTFNLVISKRFAPLLLYAAYNGTELGYYMAVLPDLAGESVFREKNKENWTDEDELECNMKTCIAMLGVGFGQLVTAWASGWIGQHLGKRSTFHMNFVLSMLSLAVAFFVTIVYRVLLTMSYITLLVYCC